MDAALIGIAGTLLGGLVGGLLTHWNSTALAKLEMNWQVVRIRQEKLEEIATLLDVIQQHYSKLMGEILLKIETGKPFSESTTRIPYERLRILIEFYAPSMLEDWPKLEKGKEEFGKVFVDALPNNNRTKPEKQGLNSRAFAAADNIANICRSLSTKAAKLANEVVEAQTATNALQRTCSFAARR